MPPSFLNSREDAMLLWTVAFLVWVVPKDPRGIGGSFLNVVRAFFVPPILLVLGSALLYSAAVAYVAHDAGLWHATALKATVYWFLGTGTVLIADAASTTARNSREWLREVLRRVIAVTVVTEFVVNACASAAASGSSARRLMAARRCIRTTRASRASGTA